MERNRSRGVVVAAVLAAIAAWWFLPRGAEVPALPPGPTRGTAASAPATAASSAPSDAAPAEPPAPVVAPAAEGPFTLRGRVVDHRRFPAAGAEVRVVLRGEFPRATIADPDGRFAFAGLPAPGGNWPTAGFHARGPGGAAAIASIVLPPGKTDHDMGVLTLGPAADLAVRATAEGEPVSGAVVVAGPVGATCLRAETGADGIALLRGVPHGGIHLFGALATRGLVGRAEAAVPAADAAPVALQLVPARTVEVRAVRAGTTEPVPGATFDTYRYVATPGFSTMVPPELLLPPAPTDADGRTSLVGTVPSDVLWLQSPSAPGHPAASRTARSVVKEGETSVTLELSPGRELRFSVEPGEAPVPPDGAEIRLETMEGTMTPAPRGSARMEGTTLVVPDAPAATFHAVAVAPDGSRARVFDGGKGVRSDPVVFAPARRIEVRARLAGGGPAAGRAFGLRNQGNSPVGTPVIADAEGRAVFEGLRGDQLVEVAALADVAKAWGGTVVGSVDLRKGDGLLECVLPATRRFVARVTVDGKPGLPGSYVLYPLPTVVSEDPEKGEIVFDVVPHDSGEGYGFTLQAAGYLTGNAVLATLPPADPVPVPIEIRSGGSLLLSVKPPPAPATYQLHLLVLDDSGTWTRSAHQGGPAGFAPGPDGVVRLEPLAEGRYRVLEPSVGLLTETAEVRAGSTPARVALDLSRRGIVTGRVEAPPGTDLALARIRREGDGVEPGAPMDPYSFLPPVQADGTFQCAVPGDRTVRLVPWHPLLRAAAAGGAVEVGAAVEGVVLRLEEGSSAFARLEPAPATTRDAWQRPKIHLYRGAAEGTPTLTLPLVVRDGVARFAGHEPGTWTLLADIPGRAPVLRPGVVLGEGEVDCGPWPLVDGARVVCRVVPKAGSAVPRVSLTASRKGGAAIYRNVNSRGEAEVVLVGLGPGTWTVSAAAVMGGGGRPPVTREITVTGDESHAIELEL